MPYDFLEWVYKYVFSEYFGMTYLGENIDIHLIQGQTWAKSTQADSLTNLLIQLKLNGL